MFEHTEQPPPVPNDRPHIADLVAADIAARKAIGIERYGVALQTNNGRDALRDLYEELIDATLYVRQEFEERAEASVTISRLIMAAKVAVQKNETLLMHWADADEAYRQELWTDNHFAHDELRDALDGLTA